MNNSLEILKDAEFYMSLYRTLGPAQVLMGLGMFVAALRSLMRKAKLAAVFFLVVAAFLLGKGVLDLSMVGSVLQQSISVVRGLLK